MKFAFEAAGGDFVLLAETPSVLFLRIISSRVSMAYSNIASFVFFSNFLFFYLMTAGKFIIFQTVLLWAVPNGR